MQKQSSWMHFLSLSQYKLGLYYSTCLLMNSFLCAVTVSYMSGPVIVHLMWTCHLVHVPSSRAPPVRPWYLLDVAVFHTKPRIHCVTSSKWLEDGMCNRNNVTSVTEINVFQQSRCMALTWILFTAVRLYSSPADEVTRKSFIKNFI